MWISELLLPFLFLHTSGCVPPVVPPDAPAAVLPPGVLLLQAANASTPIEASTPILLSLIQSPPEGSDRPAVPERPSVGCRPAHSGADMHAATVCPRTSHLRSTGPSQGVSGGESRGCDGRRRRSVLGRYAGDRRSDAV